MDRKIQKIIPDYKTIYTDILERKFPDKKEEYKYLLDKETFSVADVIELDKKIFGITIENEKFNQRHRSYTEAAILEMLCYQKKNKLNNKELAFHFKLSRNTVTKWKKIFLV